MTPATQTYPSVDIIIPYYKRRDMLERCLDSLENTIYPSMSIIVVDNGGKEAGLVFLVKRYRNARLERLAVNRGYAGGCNAGLKCSSADYVVFSDGDCIPLPHFIAQHQRLAESGWFLAGNRILMNEPLTRRVLDQGLSVHTWTARRWLTAKMTGQINRVIP